MLWNSKIFCAFALKFLESETSFTTFKGKSWVTLSTTTIWWKTWCLYALKFCMFAFMLWNRKKWGMLKPPPPVYLNDLTQFWSKILGTRPPSGAREQNGQSIKYPKKLRDPSFPRFYGGNIKNYTLNNDKIERFKPEVRWWILNLIPASNSEGLIILNYWSWRKRTASRI